MIVVNQVFGRAERDPFRRRLAEAEIDRG